MNKFFQEVRKRPVGSERLVRSARYDKRERSTRLSITMEIWSGPIPPELLFVMKLVMISRSILEKSKVGCMGSSV